MSQVQQLNREERSEGSDLLLRVNNLSVNFTKSRGIVRRQTSVIKAVDDVSLELREGDIVSLVGESGSGKTTLARCIVGLTTPTKGSIYYRDKDVTKLKGKELLEYRKEAQMIFQDPFEALNSSHDVFTTVSIPIRKLTGEKNYSVIYDKISALLEEIGLVPEEVMNRYPHQLSGGQRQRVNIARALASDPKLLIADEPITMLDAAQRINMLALLSELKARRNLTILMITHDLASSKVMSQKTIVMYLGKIVENGPTDVLLSSPHHPYVELILSATPRLKKRSAQLLNKASVSWIEESEQVKSGCIFEPRCMYATPECREVEPKLKELSESHFAACYHPLNLVAKEPQTQKKPDQS